MATWPSAGKGLPLQGNVFAVTGGSSGKAVHGLWRHGQALAQGCRCRATCVRWPGKAAAKQAHRRVLCRDGRCFAHVLKPSTWSMATWPGAGKGLPLQGNVFAVTWEGSGKAVKAHRRVLCRDGPCFAHVLKPSKWSMATWPGAGKGLPLQGNVFAVTWEGSGKAVKAHRRFCVVMGRASRTFWNPLNGVEYGDNVARRWQRAAAAGQRVRGDLGRQALAQGCRCRSTWCAVTWEGPHRRVLCPDGPCFAHVLNPSTWSMATSQALAKGCRCRAMCSRWLGKAAAKW